MERDGVFKLTLQGLEGYENLEEERAFIRAVTEGLMEIKEGREQDLSEIKKEI